MFTKGVQYQIVIAKLKRSLSCGNPEINGSVCSGDPSAILHKTVFLPLDDRLEPSFRAVCKYFITQAWNPCKDVEETLKQVKGD